jgi:MoaA/NifB/PqqE/SkfB family radical SAM enzyme
MTLGTNLFVRYARQFLRNMSARNAIHFLIFFVTARCNCRCSTCFYWQELNAPEELSVDEIRRIARSVGNVHTLLLSGGEPFLRKDLFEICRIWIEENRLSILSIPTNGTQSDEVAGISERIAKEYPHLTLSVAVSLDGFKEHHDAIRGVDGVFDRAIETIRRLEALKRRYANLEVAVNTVITDRNADEIVPLMDYLYGQFSLDFHAFELLRGDYRDKAMGLPPLEKIRALHRSIAENRERYLRRRRTGLPGRIAVLGLLLFTQKMKEAFLETKRTPLACTAGKNIGVIDANGDVKLCELMPPIGNLKNMDYDFRALWNSGRAGEARGKITRTHCSCTHICFLSLSASRSLATVPRLLRYYRDYRKGR